MRIAIVTGASSGMGAEFCRALDGRSLDCIWLIARREDRLEELASELETECRVISADLTRSEELGKIGDMIRDSDAEIGYLINCAGFGRFGRTWEMPDGSSRSMIDLNITSLVEITSMCIPYMHHGSMIVEVCSASAYLPLEMLNVYASTKAFVRHFCNGLRGELKGSGISVLEVSPGWVKTDFISISSDGADIPAGVFKHTVTKEDVVSKAMSDCDRGRRRSICGPYNRMQVFMCTHVPSLAMMVWRRSLR